MNSAPIEHFNRLPEHTQRQYHDRYCFWSNIALLDFQVNPEKKNIPILVKLLKSTDNNLNSAIDFQMLKYTAKLPFYSKFPEIKKLLKQKKFLPDEE